MKRLFLVFQAFELGGTVGHVLQLLEGDTVGLVLLVGLGGLVFVGEHGGDAVVEVPWGLVFLLLAASAYGLWLEDAGELLLQQAHEGRPPEEDDLPLHGIESREDV